MKFQMISKWRGLNKVDARYQNIPERVRNAISAQQDASEKLVGWIQTAVVFFFGLLYAVSPKTFSRDMTFEPVPWFLGIWLAVTMIRLYLAYRNRMSAPLLYLSIIIDIGLLLGMIWSFHLQYQQPPTFYLKSPTLLYVFIFIALRALRFEARYVITAGVVAAIGWATMAIYATLTSGGMDVVTRDYVYYLTSNSVLAGAELDKIITILTVTAIIAVAITRAQKLLVKAAAEGAAAHDLSRFFSPEISRQIITAEQEVTAGTGKARDAAILMVDIRGFTPLATMVKPDDLVSLLAEYQSLIVPIIQSHGGTIDKFMGDGIMATFGAAVTSPTYAADAMRAVDDIMEAASVWGAELRKEGRSLLKIGAAVTAGRIIFGAVGDESRMEYTVIGDAVNLSAKLEKHTKTEGVRALCTASAFDVAARQGYQPSSAIERRKSRQIEGVDHPVDIIVLAP
jgi:adenylate cyclase